MDVGLALGRPPDAVSSWAKSGEYVTQVTAIGPLGLEYLNAKDDPRNNNS
jgi:hypothetical protein